MAIKGDVAVKDLLPLGSVVKIVGLDRKFMIVRYFYKVSKEITLFNGNKAEPGEVFDYVCVLWPDGDVNPDKKILFNHETIDYVQFYGYVNDESIEFLDDLDKEVNGNGD